LPDNPQDSRDYAAHNIDNQKGRKQLGDFLQRDGKLISGSNPFDYTGEEWLPRQWRLRAFNYYPIARNLVLVDGLQAAMGAFNLRALAKGYSEPTQGGYMIHVTEVYVFVQDTFAFTADEPFLFWSCAEKELVRWYDFWILLHPDSYRWLSGTDFISFRQRHGRGGDFPVISSLHKVENFEGKPYYYPWPPSAAKNSLSGSGR
jgi:hypothetical protein